MRRCLSALLLLLSASVLAGPCVVVSSLPEASTPDAEVSTNFALRADAARLEQLTLSVAFDSCETNEVLVALGADEDADGDLSFDEAALVFGCDCGAWYLADLRTGEAASIDMKSRDQQTGKSGWMVCGSINSMCAVVH